MKQFFYVLRVPRACILTLVISIFISPTIQAQIFVNMAAAGNNDGSSWANAYTELADALDNYSPGDEIWVAAGIYFPQQPSAWTGAPKNTFYIHQEVGLYGGFNGTETSSAQRDPETNITLLSGDLNIDDVFGDFITNRSDNATNVIYVEANITPATVIDGFMIMGGHANGDLSQEFNYAGGGLWSWGSPRINQCTFTQNYAAILGGGLILREQAASEAHISHCAFNQNQSGQFGGGLVLFGLDSSKVVQIDSCQFFQNHSSQYGGGMAAGPASYAMRGCQFLQNSSGLAGGGLSETLSPQAGSNYQVSLTDCQFTENTSTNGGGYFYESLAAGENNVSLTNCDFTDNQGLNTGNALFIAAAGAATARDSFMITDCRFEGNNGAQTGGALSLISLTEEQLYASISNCQFSQNSAMRAGGALYLSHVDSTHQSDLRIINCLVEDNVSSNGGGLYYYASGKGDNNLHIMDTDFLNNQAIQNVEGDIGGGGIQVSYVGAPTQLDSIQVTGCRFEGNSSAQASGGLSYTHFAGADNHLTVAECAFIDNEEESGFAVGGMGIADGGISYSVQVRNTHFSGNVGSGTSAFGLGAPSQEPAPMERDVELINCLFTDHAGSGFVLSTNRGFAMTNCTVANNQKSALSTSESGNIVLQNNILKDDGFPNLSTFGQQGPPILSLGGNMISDASLNDHLINSDQSDQVPFFKNGTYELSENSPAVDAGVSLIQATAKDLLGNNRIQGSGIDIGAIESPYGLTSVAQALDRSMGINLYPNPATSHLTLSLENTWQGPMDVLIINQLGQQIMTTTVEKSAGSLRLPLDISHLPGGSYRLLLMQDSRAVSGSFVKLK